MLSEPKLIGSCRVKFCTRFCRRVLYHKPGSKGLYRKNEMGNRLKPENLRSWTIPIRHPIDGQVTRNWHTTVLKSYKNICNVYVKNTSLSRDRTPSNGSTTGHVIQTETRDNNTALPLVGVLVTWPGRINNIINYIC